MKPRKRKQQIITYIKKGESCCKKKKNSIGKKKTHQLGEMGYGWYLGMWEEDEQHWKRSSGEKFDDEEEPHSPFFSLPY